jgi:hypothetical protein
MIFSVPNESLKEFTNVSGKYDYSCLPSDKYRTDEEVKGSKQVELEK